MTVDTPMDLSTKTRRKLRLEEFLRQNLDQAPATHVIQWVNRDQGIFRILWTHQSSGAFTQQDAALFRYWALARGKPANLSSVELKQSLRMALNKSPSVERLTCAVDEYRYFRFTDWANRRKNLMGQKGTKSQQQQHQESTRQRSPARPLAPTLQHWSQDHQFTHNAGAEKLYTPSNSDQLKELSSTGTYNQISNIGYPPFKLNEENNKQQEQQGDKNMISNHVREQSMNGLSFLPQHYTDESYMLDFRIRGKATLQEHLVSGSGHFLEEQYKYLSKTHSPQQVYTDLQHAVPSYKESLIRPEHESSLNLYGDGAIYSKSLPHYNSMVATAASLYRVPEQDLPIFLNAHDSRLIGVSY